jgi:uncharacterized protein
VADSRHPGIDPQGIIGRFYPVGGRTRELLLRHGELVGRKALQILDRAPWLKADREFVVQAAMLHDIGIGRTRCPELGCTGRLPYLCHGVEGVRCLMIWARATWAGLRTSRGGGTQRPSGAQQPFPFPIRDMLPLSVEEQLICYADKFFSKTDNGRHEKGIREITAGLARFETEYVGRFLALHRRFTREPGPLGSGSAGTDCHNGGKQ